MLRSKAKHHITFILRIRMGQKLFIFFMLFGFVMSFQPLEPGQNNISVINQSNESNKTKTIHHNEAQAQNNIIDPGIDGGQIVIFIFFCIVVAILFGLFIYCFTCI